MNDCDKLPGVYALTCIDGTVKYIGAAKRVMLRARSHWKVFSGRKIAGNSLLKKWFESLAVSPIIKIIEVCRSYEQALEREKFWIRTYRAYEEASCNLADGGNAPPSGAGRMGGKATGAINIRKKQIQTFEGSSKGGKATGRTNILKTPPKTRVLLGKAVGILYGSIGGSKGGPVANHNRWHVKRNIFSSSCKLCKEEISMVAYG